MVSKFAAGVRAVKDDSCRAVLNSLWLHFALKHVQENGMDWAGAVPAAQLHAVEAKVTALLAAIRPDAVALVGTPHVAWPLFPLLSPGVHVLMVCEQTPSVFQTATCKARWGAPTARCTNAWWTTPARTP